MVVELYDRLIACLDVSQIYLVEGGCMEWRGHIQVAHDNIIGCAVEVES